MSIQEGEEKSLFQLMQELEDHTQFYYKFPPYLKTLLRDILNKVRVCLRQLDNCEINPSQYQDIYYEVLLAIRFCIVLMESFRNPRRLIAINYEDLADISTDKITKVLSLVPSNSENLDLRLCRGREDYLSNLDYIETPLLFTKEGVMVDSCLKLVQSKQRECDDDIFLI